ncbi:helix-turn-helix domain-containing protein [Pseudonocardia sp. GCM10023141]|uniref:helix-turn-helix domain-containing protein n=1 Tax=Pseudonocardia sp. GCM10023141 TaxID=3252653 RepID=UPI00360BFF8D
MAAPQSPIGSRRRLGAELRRLRNKAHLTLDEVADLMTCSTSKISRLETGKGVPKIPDVRELMRIYGVTGDTEQDMLLRLVHDGREHGWWEPLTEGVTPDRFVMDHPARYASLETEASAVRAFEVAVLHGLVQTPEYARATLEAFLSERDPQELDQLVELRIRRQEALNDRDPLLAVFIVIDESTLHRVVGSRELMVEQLQYLLELSGRRNIDIRVLPFEVGVHRALNGPFVVLEFPTGVGADVVYIEGHAGDAYLETPSDVDLYKGVFADVTRRALNPDASRGLISRWLSIHASPKGSPQ